MITRRIRRVGTASAATVAVTTIAIATAVSGAERPASDAARTRASATPPNFLFVLVDDQAMNSFRRRYMPKTFKWIVDRGTKFTDALAAPPLCCPDRAGLITGQYPHNNRVWANDPGYPELTDRANTLPVWLHRAGYRTGFFGKFLNHYSTLRQLEPAPGFDRWFAFTQEYNTYYDYNLSDDGVRVPFGNDRADYSTDVLTDEAGSFIRNSLQGSQPFSTFLWYTTPHVNRVESGPCAGSNPVPPDDATYQRFAHAKLPKPASFDEADVSDKPQAVARLPRLDHEALAAMRTRWRCTLAALSGVDDALGGLMAQLHRERALRNTIVIYLSDNGVFFGEHRVPTGKGLIYEPALRVPFAVSVPPAYRTAPLEPKRDAVVANQDIAPTMLRYVNRYGGRARPCNPRGNCRPPDGHNLLPLLQGGGHWKFWSRGVLAEIDSRHTAGAPRAARRRRDPECNCAYEAIRTHRYVYSELSTGERELYDLARDPDELRNRASSARYAKKRRRLADRLHVLERCSGHGNRKSRSGPPACE